MLCFRDSSQSIDGDPVYMFDMAALSDHLRSQGETNKSASYFNIDILKYQVRFKVGDRTGLRKLVKALVYKVLL